MPVRPNMQLPHQWILRIFKIKRLKEGRRTEEQVVRMSVVPELGLAALRAADVRRAQEQGAQSGLDLSNHLPMRQSSDDAVLGTYDFRGLCEVWEAGVCERSEVCREALSAHCHSHATQV